MVTIRLSTSCQQVAKREKIFIAQTSSSSQQSKILTITQNFPKIKTDESFLEWLSRGCQGAVRRLAVRGLSGKNHHNFEAVDGGLDHNVEHIQHPVC